MTVTFKNLTNFVCHIAVDKDFVIIEVIFLLMMLSFIA